MSEFYLTRMGRTFYEGTAVKATRALVDIAKELKTHNERERSRRGDVGGRTATPSSRTRKDYPLCPRCGGPVVCATMTSRAIENHDFHTGEKAWLYRSDALSLYCQSGDCNYDIPLGQIPYPAPEK